MTNENVFEKYKNLLERVSTDPYIFFETEYFKADVDREASCKIKDVPEGAYVCKKCGSKKVTTTQEQLRSGDEGATTIYECYECENTWR